MTKLEEFNSILSEMGTEVSNLKSLNEVYSKIDKLAKDYETATLALKANSGKLEAISKEHQTFQQGIQKTLSSVESQYQKNKQDLATLFAEKMADFQSETQIQVKGFEKNLTGHVEELSKNNKQFYKDFEDTLRIKLGENKSEVKQLVEAELNKIKENFATELEKRTNSIIKKQGSLFLMFLLTSGAMIGSLIFIIYRLLKQ